MYSIAFPKQQSMINTASHVIVAVFNGNVENLNNVSALNPFASIWTCIENIFLSTTNENLAYSMHIPLPSESPNIKKELNIPENMEIACIIGIGYPDESKRLPEQLEVNLEDKIHYNKW